MFLFLTVHQTRVCVYHHRHHHYQPLAIGIVRVYVFFYFLFVFCYIRHVHSIIIHSHSFHFHVTRYIVIMFIMSPRTFAHATQQKWNAFLKWEGETDRIARSLLVFFSSFAWNCRSHIVRYTHARPWYMITIRNYNIQRTDIMIWSKCMIIINITI